MYSLEKRTKAVHLFIESVCSESTVIEYLMGLYARVIKELVLVYPYINYAVVLERIPQKRNEFDTRDYSDTMLPEEIETVHPRFAISWRNKWMLKQSDYAATNITHS